GGAAHANPLPLIIPCHRVIGSNGNLTGFAGGLNLKKKLLQLEGVELDS
ncbi:MAG: methylated-DNA--[protein]-cysteine S-methyltransferase, partial [Desulfobulbales bacterium]